MIVQACQGYIPLESQSQPEVEGSQEIHRHVVLTRPHTLLLMASVVGGSAYRGEFTGALAKQIAKADGKVTILEMVENSIIDMNRRKSKAHQQTPFFRNTLQRTLILPPGWTTNRQIDQSADDQENLAESSV